MKKSIKKITIIAILMFIVACLSTQVLAVGKAITQDDLDSTKDEILTEVNTVKT